MYSLKSRQVDITWPMYHGDYSGRRFSTLTSINSTNVQSLSLGWIYREGVAASNPRRSK